MRASVDRSTSVRTRAQDLPRQVESADAPRMDFTILPTAAQPQLARMSIDQGIVATLSKPSSGSSFAPHAARLDLSAEAQAILAGGGPSSPDPSQESAAPGTGWE